METEERLAASPVAEVIGRRLSAGGDRVDPTLRGLAERAIAELTAPPTAAELADLANMAGELRGAALARN